MEKATRLRTLITCSALLALAACSSGSPPSGPTPPPPAPTFTIGGTVSGLPGTGQPVLRVHVRRAAGQLPDVLEIDITGRRSPRVAAYWDGCLMAMV